MSDTLTQIDPKTENIPVTLPLTVWGTLALQADALDMKLNDYIVWVALEAAMKVTPILLPPEVWLEYDPQYANVTLMDPDGWDRQNFEASWAELINRDEMSRRMSVSSCMLYKKS